MTNLFRITNNNGEVQKEIITITADNTYYKVYSSYLYWFYDETIEEHEDFSPFVYENEIFMVLITDEKNPIEVEEVFDCMMDYFCKIC